MPFFPCRLDVHWKSLSPDHGQLEFELFNLGEQTLEKFRFAYTTLTRIEDESKCENATLLSRCANLHEMAPPTGFELAPGKSWRFSAGGLTRPARHNTDGISSAYIILEDGGTHDVAIGPFLPRDGKVKTAPVLVPEGEITDPCSILPWPQDFDVRDFAPAPAAIYPSPNSDAQSLTAMGEVGALYARLYPGIPAPLSLSKLDDGVAVSFVDDLQLGDEAYKIEFANDEIIIASATVAGKTYALISLLQMLHGSHQDPEKFQFPQAGKISDAPRYQWRGCHLDVSRQVYDLSAVARFVDILAWNKLNILHWHLTDDEGWRLEIKAYPELTEIGARRGPNEKMAAQLGGGAISVVGHYTQPEIRELVANAQRINVGIMPEVDIPGHCTAVLAALPDLIDGQEAPDSYSSVQGYTNNSINPALPQTYEFLENVFKEIADLFPFPYIHVGGDEVGEGAWMASPRAKELMREESISTTAQLQAYLLGRVQVILSGLGKKMSGWDEVSHGGGVDPKDTLLMAWQNAELGPELAKLGYDVVMTPGQAYYLDMAQSEEWQEPGLNWATPAAPPKLTYEFEAVGEFPAELASKLKGIQGCIWSENLVSTDIFNHMVFPRLSAIAEAGWTNKEHKNWLRFAALCKLMPKL